MNKEQFDKLTTELWNAAAGLRTSRNAAYSGNEDYLSNFKRMAQRHGLPAGVIANILADKATSAVQKLMKGDEVPGEPVIERFADELNYVLLKWGLYNELAASKLEEERPEKLSELVRKAQDEEEKKRRNCLPTIPPTVFWERYPHCRVPHCQDEGRWGLMMTDTNYGFCDKHSQAPTWEPVRKETLP